MPEYQDYVHKWCALQEQVEKASIFSKGKRKKELEAFEEESKALKEANWDYKRNYYSLCEAWSQAWFDYCVAKGLEVKDPDVKERRKQEFAEKEKQQK